MPHAWDSDALDEDGRVIDYHSMEEIVAYRRRTGRMRWKTHDQMRDDFYAYIPGLARDGRFWALFVNQAGRPHECLAVRGAELRGRPVGPRRGGDARRRGAARVRRSRSRVRRRRSLMRDVRVASVQMESVAGRQGGQLREGGAVRAGGGRAGRRAGRSSPSAASPATGSCATSPCRSSRPLAEPVPDGPSCARLLDLAARHRDQRRGGPRRVRGRRRLPQHLRRRHARRPARPPPQDPRLRAPGDPRRLASTRSSTRRTAFAPACSSATTTTSSRTSASRRCAGPRSCSPPTRPAAAAPRTRTSWASSNAGCGTSGTRTRRRSSGSCGARRAGAG